MRSALAFFSTNENTDRNCGRRVFLDETYRTLFEDIDALEKLAVGILRLAWSRHPDDAALNALILELGRKSTRFEQSWSERHVMHPVEQSVVGFRHPQFGRVPNEAQTLLLNENADVSIYVAVPADCNALKSVTANGVPRSAMGHCGKYPVKDPF